MFLTDDITITLTDSEGGAIGTASVGEKPLTIVSTVDSYEAEYVIKILTGTNNEQQARNALEQAIPEFFDNEFKTLFRDPVSVEEITATHWKGEATYSTRVVEVPDESPGSFAFDTTGGTQHITNSNETTSFGTAPPDFKGAIGVTGKSVQGVDVVAPIFNFSKTVRLNNSDLTVAYAVALSQLTGRVNNASFLGFLEREVLFRGASGSVDQINGVNVDGQSDITFLFSANRTRENYEVGDITVTKKNGWDYQWVRYENAEDAVAEVLVQIPEAVYIEEVYLQGNFGILPFS